MTALCATRPAQWWDTGDDGNRLALALCRACPAPTCYDPHPVGVVVSGVAYGDTGAPQAVCVCGYPVALVLFGSLMCRRCSGPPLEAYRITIERLAAAGIDNAAIGRRLGFGKTTIRDARQRWANTPTPTLQGAA